MFDHLLAGDLEKGFWSRPGVGSILQASVEQHDGYVVYFQPSATPGQRRRIKEGILASPVVYRVFENTAPTEAHLK
ncbi:MAG TPA: hypothetical protein VOA87_06700 [Thermoanaerobaculia bacterium]|nr:hypothetical protein [Thermoanaerobaculia bacterium]